MEEHKVEHRRINETHKGTSKAVTYILIGIVIAVFVFAVVQSFQISGMGAVGPKVTGQAVAAAPAMVGGC